MLTEAGTKRRAAVRAALRAENRTLKRALTDPRFLSGIGNAYSDEILHAARLSPVALTHKLTDDQWRRLYDATQATLRRWVEKLRADAAVAFPEGVTAFRPDFAVQRIRYAEGETNYCARCQTGGVLLADRNLSRLRKSDWPRTLEELDALKRR